MESGYHSERWFHLDQLFVDRARLQPFVNELARRLAPHGIEAICGPATGGAQLAEMIGAQLGVPAFRTERFEPADATGLFPIQYRVPAADREKIRDQRIALVDDAISAGSAVKGTHADLLACGARPVACGALIIFGEAADKFAADNHLSLACVSRMSFGM